MRKRIQYHKRDWHHASERVQRIPPCNGFMASRKKNTDTKPVCYPFPDTQGNSSERKHHGHAPHQCCQFCQKHRLTLKLPSDQPALHCNKHDTVTPDLETFFIRKKPVLSLCVGLATHSKEVFQLDIITWSIQHSCVCCCKDISHASETTTCIGSCCGTGVTGNPGVASNSTEPLATCMAKQLNLALHQIHFLPCHHQGTHMDLMDVKSRRSG